MKALGGVLVALLCVGCFASSSNTSLKSKYDKFKGTRTIVYKQGLGDGYTFMAIYDVGAEHVVTGVMVSHSGRQWRHVGDSRAAYLLVDSERLAARTDWDGEQADIGSGVMLRETIAAGLPAQTFRSVALHAQAVEFRFGRYEGRIPGAGLAKLREFARKIPPE